MVTLVPVVIVLAALVAVSLLPFVGAFALLVSLVALLLWGLWKAAANLLDLTGENVFRLAKASEGLFGRGGPDDPEWILVPRTRRMHEPPQPAVVPAESPSQLTQDTKGATMNVTGAASLNGSEKAVLAGGCFWGMQDLIRKRPGVLSTRVGYAGGDVPNATYRNHGTHAEAIEIIFDPEQTSYRDLLEFFFQIHDPTTLNRQGYDIGTSYRSAIFYLDEEQRRVAEETIADVEASGLWPGKVVTEVTAAGPFWEAEREHQDYLERYPNGYTCHFPRRDWVLPRRTQSVAS